MIVRLLPEAEEELEHAAQWYEDRLRGLGEQFLEAVIDAILSIEKHPRRYARVHYLKSRKDVRRFMLGRFPYSVVYRLGKEEALVVAVAHVSRRPGYWRKRMRRK
jgi:plasmid stabilization system protein ParE